jgi:hypothetical protein
LFLKMNPRISPRKPECTRSNRFISFNNFAVKKYSDNVDLLMEKFKVAESTVFNVGETEMSTKFFHTNSCTFTYNYVLVF